MKKIFAYVGSPKGSDSYTWKLTKLVLEQAALFGAGEIEYKLFSADQKKINFCCGCCSCFNKGFCPFDTADAMGALKDEMLQSDLIILSSPVYAHNVTGNMKVFLDRISYWMHLFRLTGKLGITISSSDSNGNEQVNGYLNKLMQLYGLHVICNFMAVKINNPLTPDNNFLNLNVSALSELIYDYLIHNKPIKATKTQEALFQHMKSYLLELETANIQNPEYTYWKEHKYLECDSYSDLLTKVGHIKL